MSLASDLGAELVRAYLPLERALRSGYEFRNLLRDMGWWIDLSAVTDAVVAAVPGAGELAAAVPDAVDAMRRLTDGPSSDGHGHGDGEQPADATAAAELADALVRILDAGAQLATFDPAGVLPAGAGRLADPAFWADLAADLPEYLIVRWIRSYHPVAHAVLRLAGVIEDAVRPDLAGGSDTGYERLVWSRLGALVTGGAALPAEVYGWGGPLDHARLTSALRGLGAALGVRSTPVPVPESMVGAGEPFPADHPDLASVRGLDVGLVETVAGTTMAEAGIVALPVPHSSAAGSVAAMLVTLRAVGSVEPRYRLAGGTELTVEVTADATGTSGIEIGPSGVRAVGSTANAGLDLGLDVTPEQPWRFPRSGSPALRLGGAAVTAGIAAGHAAEWRVSAQLRDGELILLAGDGLLAEILGLAELGVPFDLDLEWSSVNGLTIGGAVGLAVGLPLDVTIGPIRLSDLRLELAAGADGSAAVTATLTVTGVLGPFAVTVEGLGLAMLLSPSEDGRGSLGAVAMALQPVPPDGLALAIDAPLTAGGGRISIDSTSGRYEGALALTVGGIGVGVLVVVDTEVPGQVNGWAFFGSLSATFPGIPLGFGFSLTGVGGVLALNRALDAEALATGLREGAADALLFPQDPVRDAEVLIADLDLYFPLVPGNTVIGPVIEISWGIPVLITGQLGIVISLPQGVIAVLGSVAALLPVPQAPLLELHLDTLGVVDLAAGTLLVTASVYDSRLLGLIELSGDAAVYLSIGADPYFMLSVGGFHPGFQPPATVPSVFGSLRRLRADVVLGLGVAASITAYFAITPNTLQMGGGFELAATAEVALSSYTARGWFEFDVLLQLDPFLLVTHVSAGVGVYCGDRELLGVQLDAHVEGPEPWYAVATASFKFFGIRVPFEVTVGGSGPPTTPASVDVHDLVTDQLELDAAWSAEHATGALNGIVLGPGVPDDALRPDDRLVVRQRVAPLDHPLERFGTFAPVQSTVSFTAATMLDAAGAPLPGAASDSVLDWFAPADYAALSAQERLAAPSYELMSAGVSIGTDEIAIPSDPIDQPIVPAGHETSVWEPATGTVRYAPRPVVAPLGARDVIAASTAGRHAVMASRPRVAGVSVAAGSAQRTFAGGPVGVRPTSYVVVDGLSGGTTSRAATDFTSALRGTDPGQRLCPAGAVVAR